MATTNAQILDWAERYVALRNEVTRLETEMKVLKENLLMNIPEGEKMVLDGRIVTHSISNRTTLNTKLFQEEHPNIHKQYLVTNKVTSLLVK